jgi:ribonuclease HI
VGLEIGKPSLMTSPVEIFTDGSTAPRNPGFGGAASVILYEDNIIVRAEYIGFKVTSNQSELNAIKHALEAYIEYVGDLDREVIVYSDSNYSLGVVAGQYKPKKNKKLIYEIHKYRDMIPNLRLFWIRSHRNPDSVSDEETKKLIHWNSVADHIAGKTARRGKDYSFSETMSIKDFKERYTKIED